MNNKIFAGISGFSGLILISITAFVVFGSNKSEAKPDTEKETDCYKVVSPPMPSKADFAGENVPLQFVDTYERLDKELMYNMYMHSTTIIYIKRANRYFPYIEAVLRKNNVPDDFKYLAIAESGLQPRIVSPAGAGGLWQFMETTGKQYGLEITADIDDRYNVEKSTEAACVYLKQAYAKFGNWTLAAASYNCGMNGLAGFIEKQQTNDFYNLYLPAETMRYMFRIIALKELFQNPSKYGFMLTSQDLYPIIPCKEVILSEALIDVYAFARQQGVSYYSIREYNPWLKTATINNKLKKNISIRVPENESLMMDRDKIEAHDKNWVIDAD